ncbi:hypothetical protein KEH51_18175 [[Brevibacterium] frigoritolerans]|uniref:Response regulatory domain-containing protein n=1 Tax=Peribacillus frigoritolerans TaxID=450367 RepID=A0A941FJK9_9BACI|nr:hypothetical protein [Peribacillus frigoritolerans]
MASELAYAEDYDLIIVDLMIPKKNGVQLIKELRMNGKMFLFLFSVLKIQ